MTHHDYLQDIETKAIEAKTRNDWEAIIAQDERAVGELVSRQDWCNGWCCYDHLSEGAAYLVADDGSAVCTYWHDNGNIDCWTVSNAEEAWCWLETMAKDMRADAEDWTDGGEDEDGDTGAPLP